MKQKLSVSIEQEILENLDVIMRDTTYRNKSHFVEVAMKKLMTENRE
jgi:metal-responsive CopG/Arc/MetJ family transcriptional regulator